MYTLTHFIVETRHNFVVMFFFKKKGYNITTYLTDGLEGWKKRKESNATFTYNNG